MVKRHRGVDVRRVPVKPLFQLRVRSIPVVLIRTDGVLARPRGRIMPE